MKKLKVYVYAICKNESKFIERWYESVKEADGIYVLDTGSTDDSVKIMKRLGIHVTTKVITPWRFDVARNLSLDCVPENADICVSTDLDEVIEPGWRETLERLWNTHHLTQLRYLYNWSFDEFGKPATTFYGEKIHNRNGYYWNHPVHEVITKKDEIESSVISTDEIVINHYPDQTKSRGNYLPLLEMSVKESPEDDRNMHYLGREYMYYKKWDKCIKTLHQHLKLPSATWKDERCASMRFMARSYLNKNYLEEAEMWYQKAISEAPYLREGYIELAQFYYKHERLQEAYELITQAGNITHKSQSYINEVFAWNEDFEDLYSLIAFYAGHVEESLEHAKKAVLINPNVERLQENVRIIESVIKKESRS